VPEDPPVLNDAKLNAGAAKIDAEGCGMVHESSRRRCGRAIAQILTIVGAKYITTLISVSLLDKLQSNPKDVRNLIMWVDVSVEQRLAIPKSNLKLTAKVLETLMDCAKIHKVKTAAIEKNNCLSRSGVRFPINTRSSPAN